MSVKRLKRFLKNEELDPTTVLRRPEHARGEGTQTDKHTDRQAHRLTNTQTDKHTDKQTHRLINTHLNKHTDEQTHRLTNTQMNKHTD